MQADSDRPKYSAEAITVVTFVEAVRRRPRMYFGLSRDDPKLMAVVAGLAAMEPFRQTNDAPVHVTLTIDSDMSFTVEDDLPTLPAEDGGSSGATAL